MSPRTLAALFLSLAVLGCSSLGAGHGGDQAPDWVGYFGLIDGPNGRLVEAVGSSAAAVDPSSRRMTALSNGRLQLALTVQSLSSSLVEECLEALGEGVSVDLVESGRLVETVSRQVTDGVMRVPAGESDPLPQRWTDPLTKTDYVLMSLPLDAFATQYRRQMARAFQRESTLGGITAGDDEFSEVIEEQLEDLEDLDLDDLNDRFPSRVAGRS
ncbi:MAG: hypothetical protein ACI9EF_003823 [Pseudohongiellaceae bacterium]|jgi:hypothetical protein